MVSFDARGRYKEYENTATAKSCGNFLQTFMDAGEHEHCEAIAVYLYPDMLQEIFKNEIPSYLVRQETPQPKNYISNVLIEQYMQNLSIYFENIEAFDEELGILKLKELILILLKSENHENVRKLLSDYFAPVNIKFREAIDNNIFNPLSMEELAFICNMSLSTFKREFKKTFETTPAKYIKSKRLDYAACELTKTEDSITDIAYRSGFQDVTTFSANFHEKFESSPSKYRLSHIRK